MTFDDITLKLEHVGTLDSGQLNIDRSGCGIPVCRDVPKSDPRTGDLADWRPSIRDLRGGEVALARCGYDFAAPVSRRVPHRPTGSGWRARSMGHVDERTARRPAGELSRS